MDYKVVESTQIVWCHGDDRYVMITKKNDEVIGLSYMQGDELDDFKEYFCEIDEELTDFYNAICDRLIGATELDRINQAIWAHFNYRELRDERRFKKVNEIKL
jgi:hypothetical protein